MADVRAPELRAEPAPGRAPKGIGAVGWLRWAWRQLTSMRTALILLFLVALASVPGGLLPQRAQAPEKVTAYLQQHKQLGPWLDRLSLFDVFAAPWFAAIYLLLFVSLAGCVIPRAWKHLQTFNARPPAAPRHLSRLPQNAVYETDAAPQEVLGRAREELKRRRFRVDLHAGPDHPAGAPVDGPVDSLVNDPASPGWVAAEKGHLGEFGNLVFHLSLLTLLFAVAAGAAFGYKGNVLVTEGKGFSNTLAYYDSFKPGRAFSAQQLPPFTLDLDSFKARYATKGSQTGLATDFHAKIRYAAGSGPQKPYDLQVNSPLNVGGAKVYLLGHGYSPTFTVRDGKGQIAFQDPVPFLPLEPKNLTSEGVVKVPDARPEQLAFYGVFYPSAAPDSKGKAVSAFPAPLNPMVSIVAFRGNLGLDSGTPQSVYQLVGMGKTLFPVKNEHGVVVQQLMAPGQTLTLPNGLGSITFDGYKQWVSLQITHDPGRMPALIAGIIAIFGITTSFLIRRRRVWVRASVRKPGTGEGGANEGRTVVEIGGLTLGSATSEFDDIVAALRKGEASGGNSQKASADGPQAPTVQDENKE